MQLNDAATQGFRSDHGTLNMQVQQLGVAQGLGNVELRPDKLTYRQRFRLIEIAHETQNERIRAAAVALLVEGS